MPLAPDARVASAQHLCDWLEQMLAVAAQAEWDALGDMAERHAELSRLLQHAMERAAQPPDQATTNELRHWLTRASTLHEELLMRAEPERDSLGQALLQGRRQHAIGRAYNV